MRSRKMFSVALAAILGLSLLCGCGNKQANESFYKVNPSTTQSAYAFTSTPESVTSQTDLSVATNRNQSSTVTTATQNTAVNEATTTTGTTVGTATTITYPETKIPENVGAIAPMTNIPVVTTQVTTPAAIPTHSTTVNTSKTQTTSNSINSERLVTTVDEDEYEDDTEEISYVSSNSAPETEYTQNDPIPEMSSGMSSLPQEVLDTVKYWEQVYPGVQIGVGIYSLDGSYGYEYNAYTPINSACTIKAPYALYVLKTCEANGIDIWTKTLEYKAKHRDRGTSVISETGTYGNQYTVAELLQLLLGFSDNTAYTILCDEFPISGMYNLIVPIGGQNDWQKWGAASVSQRKNEWVAINSYINSGSLYSSVLRDYLTGTSYSYLTDGMYGWHSYMQKSGWTENTPDYPAANAGGIIDNSFILIVMTQDYSTSIGHVDICRSIGGSVESFINNYGGIENIF